jgi:hemerythrin-like domain-containing protein
MNAVERLRRDHAMLRTTLSVLETGLQMGPEAWSVLRQMCFTLSRQLRDHIRREEELVAASRKALDPRILAEVALEHRDEPAHLRAITRLFVSEPTHSLERVGPALTNVIRALRHHMDEEEAELFPVLERTLTASDAQELSPLEPAIRETMTVNRVLQEFPQTRQVFERLFINIQMEGCGCLDEVAWRHGMDSRELLERLQEAIDSCQCHAAPASSIPSEAPAS